MNDFSTEEEQVAALKKWWKDNGNSLLIGVGVALAIAFGWKAYQGGVIEDKTQASFMYQQLITAATQTSFEEAEEAQTVSYLASDLKNKYSDSEYAIYAAMFIAKESVEANDLETAKVELNWILANTDDSRIMHIVKGRIARILSAEDKHDEALAMLNADDSDFEASYLEIKGDIKQRTGDRAAAIEAYKSAFELVKDSPQAQPLLAVKLSNLGINPETL